MADNFEQIRSTKTNSTSEKSTKQLTQRRIFLQGGVGIAGLGKK